MHLERLQPRDAPEGLILCPECDNETFELHEDGEATCCHCGTSYALRRDLDDVGE